MKKTGKVISFESTPYGRNLTVELEAPNDAKETCGTDGENRTHERTAFGNQTDVDWNAEDTSFLAGKGTDL